MVRRVDTWTVLKFSVLFYLSLLIVVLVAGVLLWGAASAAGVIDNVEKFFKDLFVLDSFRIRAGLIFRATTVGGLVLVLMGTGANVLMAVIYNLTSDVVGGIEFSVLEEDTKGRRASV